MRIPTPNSCPLDWRTCKLSPFLQRKEVGLCCERLNANVIGPCRLMGTNSVANGVQIAPRDDCINQTVATTILAIIA